MGCRANVIVVDEEHPADNSSLVEALEGCGCTVSIAAPGEAAIAAVRAGHPDLVIVQALETHVAALDVARALKADTATAHTPIILLADASDRALMADGVEAGVDDILPIEYRDAELNAHLHVLMRLNVMRSELARRALVQRRYGVSRVPLSPDPVDNDGMTVLTAGNFGRDLETLTAALGHAPRLTFADTPMSALEKLNAGRFEAVVVAIDGAADEWLTMCSDIRDNPRLFHLPVLLIADPDSIPDPATPYEKGASDVLIRPLDEEVLRARMTLLVKQHRDRRRMQETYLRARHLETADSLTGLYSFGYLHDYLASLIADADRKGVEFTVGFFDVSGMARINQKYGYAGGDVVLRQVAGAMGRLVRGEDLTTRYGGDQFVLVMPATPCDVAVKALRRIVDVIGQTEFGVATSEDPVFVRLKMGYVGYEKGDTAERLIARARAAIA